jgi:hypothetical protein
VRSTVSTPQSFILAAPVFDIAVALGQGHTATTQYEHYLNIPFDDDDRKEMRKWVEGWV